MNNSNSNDKKVVKGQFYKLNSQTKQNTEQVQKVLSQYHLKNVKYLPIPLDISFLNNNDKLRKRILNFHKVSQNKNKVKKIMMQLLHHNHSLNDLGSHKQIQKTNQLIMDNFLLADQVLGCICCSKTVIDGIDSHFLPFYSSIQQLTNNLYPQYLICQVKHARIICSLLNQGEGCLIIGLKIKDSKNIKKTKSKNYFRNFIAQFNRNSSKKSRKFVTKYLNELQKYIGVEGSNQEKTFNVTVEYVSVLEEQKNQQAENETQNTSFFDEDNHNDQKYLIRVKVKSLQKQKIYHVKRMYQQRQIPEYWIRNSSGDLCQITGQNIYKFARQIYKFQKKIKCFMQKKINNQLNQMQVQNRILLSQKYSQKYQFSNWNMKPTFLRESNSFLLIIRSHKQMYFFDQVKDFLEENQISFVYSEPFIQYKGLIYQRYWIFSALFTQRREFTQRFYQHFQWHADKFYKLQNFIKVKLKKREQLSPKIIQNLERLLILQEINSKITVKEEQLCAILQLKCYESWIFALIYLKTRGIHVELTNLFDIHKMIVCASQK